MACSLIEIPDWLEVSYNDAHIILPAGGAADDYWAKYRARKNVASLSVKRRLLEKRPDMAEIISAELAAADGLPNRGHSVPYNPSPVV